MPPKINLQIMVSIFIIWTVKLTSILLAYYNFARSPDIPPTSHPRLTHIPSPEDKFNENVRMMAEQVIAERAEQAKPRSRRIR